MDEARPGGYRERPARFGRAVLWSRTVTGADVRQPVLPDGCMDLLWVDGRLLIAGPDTRAYHPTTEAGTRYAGIRFFPGTAPALLGVPADQFRDRRVALADVWPSAVVRRLSEQLGEAADPLTALDRLAIQRAAETGPPDPVVSRMVAAMAAGWSVAATAAAVDVSARLLHRRALAAFGYGPKTLAKVLRLQRALAHARRGASFADTAAAAGFADQAHLARDVRALTGMPLGQVLTRSGQLVPASGA